MYVLGLTLVLGTQLENPTLGRLILSQLSLIACSSRSKTLWKRRPIFKYRRCVHQSIRTEQRLPEKPSPTIALFLLVELGLRWAVTAAAHERSNIQGAWRSHWEGSGSSYLQPPSDALGPWLFKLCFKTLVTGNLCCFGSSGECV